MKRAVLLSIVILFCNYYNLLSQPCTSPETLAGADKIICLNECTTIGCDPIQDYCYKWEPSTSLDDPSSSSPLACPLETTNYTVTITDDNGNLIGTSSCTVYVSDPANPNLDEIIAYFQGLDFTILPIINITGPALNNPDNLETKLLNGCEVENYANLLIELIDGPNQGQEIDLGQE